MNITAVILLLTSSLCLKAAHRSTPCTFFLFSSITCSSNPSVSLQISTCNFPCFHFRIFYFAAQTVLSALSTHTACQVLLCNHSHPSWVTHWCDTRNKSLRNNKLLAKLDLANVSSSSEVS